MVSSRTSNEMRAQVRLWFYSQLFMSIALENKTPYRNVFAYERVGDEKGEEMHKSKGNAIWFDDAVEKMGADIMRFMYCSQNPKIDLRFGYNAAKEVNKQLMVIWNLGNYIKLYCKDIPKNAKNLNIEDKWIISKRENLKKKVTEYLEEYQPNLAIKEIEEFIINNLSRDYVQFIRHRLNEKNVQFVLYNCFLDGLKLLGPFVPFITEKIYLDNYSFKESLFFEDWPKHDKKLIDKKLEENFDLAKKTIQEILAKREEAKLGIRWPLKKAEVYVDNVKSLDKLKEVIKVQTNVKEVLVKKGEFEIKLDTKMTKELEQEGFSREITRRIQDLRKKAGLKKENVIGLYIYSDINLDKFNKEIREKVGASKLEFKSSKKKFNDRFKIREKEIEIGFDIVK